MGAASLTSPFTAEGCGQLKKYLPGMHQVLGSPHKLSVLVHT